MQPFPLRLLSLRSSSAEFKEMPGFSLFLPLLMLSSLFQTLPTLAHRKAYVVYLGGHSHGIGVSSVDYERVTDSHHEFLASYLGSKDKAKDAMFYSYTKHINGFAAHLEEEEAKEISNHADVISVFPNKMAKLHTTRSWQFLGLEKDGIVPAESLWHQARFGEDTIIGNLDTGVWPESQSFSDHGMGPIPSKWKGVCENDTLGNLCNRKLIGMRYFHKGYEAAVGSSTDASRLSPRDYDGHGTHTLSTAGGRFVPNANVLGFANGTAKGGSPNARVAAYKVCWTPVNGSQCADADIIAAFDQAIDDGVDVLSVSLGGQPVDYFDDGLAIGSFHAVKNGITVVCSAGNSGPKEGTVSNVAPWIITVGASTVDRSFPSVVRLGNDKAYTGQSLSSTHMPQKLYPLISSKDAKASNATGQDAQLCLHNSLDPKRVKGKVVVCLRGTNGRVEKGLVVNEAGGIAMILANDETSGSEVLADAHILPAAHITYTDGLSVFAYINSTKSPVAYVTPPETELGVKPAPLMAAFSSRGPNTITPEILKPDVTAPGVSIMAAYSEAVSPTDSNFDYRRVLFNVDSGTSMACPHVAGIAGLLKTLHPDWSPAAIRSAIMTSSRSRDNTRKPVADSRNRKAGPFDYGTGHVRPNRAMDPGLVYDLSVDDYLNFLCKQGYNTTQLASFGSFKCPSRLPSILDMNHPSITLPFLFEATEVSRTLKNVGPAGTYKVRVVAPAGVSISVVPETLTFERAGEEKSYKLTLVPNKIGPISGYTIGRIAWSDGVRYVRSPIVISLDK